MITVAVRLTQSAYDKGKNRNSLISLFFAYPNVIYFIF